MAEDDSKAKDDPSVEGVELKKFLKKAKTREISFSFVPPEGKEDARFAFHMRMDPRKLSTKLRKPPEGGDDEENDEEDDGGGGKKKKSAKKFTFGMASVDGKVLTLTCVKELPGLKKKVEKLLRKEKVKMEVEVKVAGGSENVA